MNPSTATEKFSPLPLIKKALVKEEKIRQAQLAIAKKPQIQ